LGLKVNATKLEPELEEHKVLFDCKLGVTKKLDKLKLSEQGSFEDADLPKQGYQSSHPELAEAPCKNPAYQATCQGERRTGCGHFEILQVGVNKT
jgi:hypothetical protein